MSHIVRIVKQGADLTTADYRQEAVNSFRQGAFKFHDSFTIQVVTAGAIPISAVNFTPHGLDYVPAFFAQVSGGLTLSPFTYKVPFESPGQGIFNVYTDETNVYAEVIALEEATFTFEIVVFREKIV